MAPSSSRPFHPLIVEVVWVFDHQRIREGSLEDITLNTIGKHALHIILTTSKSTKSRNHLEQLYKLMEKGIPCLLRFFVLNFDMEIFTEEYLSLPSWVFAIVRGIIKYKNGLA